MIVEAYEKWMDRIGVLREGFGSYRFFSNSYERPETHVIYSAIPGTSIVFVDYIMSQFYVSFEIRLVGQPEQIYWLLYAQPHNIERYCKDGGPVYQDNFEEIVELETTEEDS